MKSFILTLAIFGFATAAVAADDVAKARVPFAFTAGTVQLPAGTYMVAKGGPVGVILIKDSAGRARAMVQHNGATSGPLPERTTMVFNRYGDRYFLSRVWVTGNRSGIEIRKHRDERELIARGENATPVAVAANIQ